MTSPRSRGSRIIYKRDQVHARRRNEHAAGDHDTPERNSPRETISTLCPSPIDAAWN